MDRRTFKLNLKTFESDMKRIGKRDFYVAMKLFNPLRTDGRSAKGGARGDLDNWRISKVHISAGLEITICS